MRDGPLPACCARSLRIRTCFRAARRRALRRRRLDGRRIGEMDGGSACIAAVTIVNFSEVHASTCVVLVWCVVSHSVVTITRGASFTIGSTSGCPEPLAPTLQ